jgi:PAS domain S-box-containing protein
MKRDRPRPGRRPAADQAAPDDATAAILESISDGVFTVDRNWRITTFNRAAETITGVPRREAVGRRCADVFRASMCEADCALRQTMASGQPVINRAAFIVDAEGRRIPISVSTALLRDARGKVIGGAETFRDLSLVEELRREIAGRFQMGDLVSQSLAMRRLCDLLPQLAESDSTLLIRGETGTGKELLARAIHGLSRRQDGPFVAVNCAALPDPLLESELFGHRKGAFTGADRDRPGRFALAEGGTLLLDEIGEISPALQVRLLRVLQERTYEPLGGSRPVKANVRILAATHRDLAALVQAGSFREDLFYRIHVVAVDLPPLRRRQEDIPLLAEHFVARLNRLQGKDIQGISPAAMAFLTAHDYPGNVRELENLVEHAFVLCPGGLIEPCHLPEDFLARRRGQGAAAKPGATLAETVAVTEAQAIRAALARHHGNRLAAARDLGLHKTTLFRKIRELRIPLPEADGRSRKPARGRTFHEVQHCHRPR